MIEIRRVFETGAVKDASLISVMVLIVSVAHRGCIRLPVVNMKNETFFLELFIYSILKLHTRVNILLQTKERLVAELQTAPAGLTNWMYLVI